MIKVIKDEGPWRELIKSFKDADCYHTYDYHHLSKTDSEESILIHYSEGEAEIALPLLIRYIEGTQYKDATSAYGYVGPLSKNLGPDFDNSKFVQELNELFKKSRIVSVFSRLNPYIPNQELLMKHMGEISTPGYVINIDLTKEPGQQKLDYQKRLNTYINKSRRQCTIKKASTADEISLFIELYHENMRRVNAAPNYFFKEEYFFRLMASKDFEAELLLAKEKETGEIVAGAIFTKKNRIVQYHLSGAREEYLHLNPIKLLLDEMRLRATHEGFRFFNLGGGVGNKADSLFQFKSKFSKDKRPFALWKHVVNEELYNDLVAQITSTKEGVDVEECEGYFPLYRCGVYSDKSEVPKSE